jgi:hypothetical protein
MARPGDERNPLRESWLHHRTMYAPAVGIASRVGSDAAYYTVADARFFPGVVALLNSVRLLGDSAPWVVVDCGLTPSQRTRLEPHATLVPMYKGLHPVLQKATGPLARPAETMVIIDADILVTRPLAPLFAEARNGSIVGFEDRYFRARTFTEWSSFGLGEPRKRSYVNCGLLILSAATADELLPVFVELQEKLDASLTHFGGAPKDSEESNPYYFADQDVLNALFSTRFDDRMVRLEHRLAPVPPFPGLDVVEGDRFECRYDDGAQPYALHHILRKPWLAALPPSPYSELFRKVVTNPAAPLRLGIRDVPPRLTDGRVAQLDRWRVSVWLYLQSRTRGKLGLRPAIQRRVRRPRGRSD